MLKGIALSSIVILLSGCFAYKVTRTDNAEPDEAAGYPREQALVATDQSANALYMRGFQCFEPMLYVLSVGLIPAECIRSYTAEGTMPTESGNATTVHKYDVTLISGWAALFLTPLPDWKFGSEEAAKSEIQKTSGLKLREK